MKKIILFIIIALLTLTFIAGCGSDGGDNNPTTAAKQKLKVGTCADNEPFEFKEGANFIGIDIDIANEIAKDLDKIIEFNDILFDDLIKKDGIIAAGEVDFGIAAISKTNERAEYMDFSDPYFDSTVVIIVRKDDDKIKTKDDLNGKKVGVQKGNTSADIAEEKINKIKIIEFDEYAQLAVQLRNGEIDAVLMDDVSALSFVNTYSEAKMLEEKLEDEVYCIAVKKGNTELLTKINTTLKRIKDDGTLDTIIKKYDK